MIKTVYMINNIDKMNKTNKLNSTNNTLSQSTNKTVMSKTNGTFYSNSANKRVYSSNPQRSELVQKIYKSKSSKDEIG